MTRGEQGRQQRICEQVQMSQYLKLNHVLKPNEYQGCEFDALTIDYFNPQKIDRDMHSFFITKVKYARTQMVFKNQGKFIELQQRIELWIKRDQEIQDILMPYFISSLDQREKSKMQ